MPDIIEEELEGVNVNQSGTTCNSFIEDHRLFLNTIEVPALLLQSEPRQVVTANSKACELFGKNLSQIEGFKGGQVFDCIHSFTEAGCGKDIHCEDCKIKNTVVDTFVTGKKHSGVRTTLSIQKQTEIVLHDMQLSTEQTGDFVVVSIERFATIV